MGKTCPTYRMLLEEEISSWDDFRRSLRREDQEAFDRIMDAARRRASSSQVATRLNPFEAIVMSALVDIAKNGPAENRSDRNTK